MSERPSLAQQIGEVRDELRDRQMAYPRLVSLGRMRQAEADHKVERLKGALDTLMWVARHEDEIRARRAGSAVEGAPAARLSKEVVDDLRARIYGVNLPEDR